MDDALDLVLGDGLFDGGAVKDAGLDERHVVRHEASETGAEIVQDDGGQVGIEERTCHMGSDVSGTAGDKPTHVEQGSDA
ncbi:hypothetical protein Back2_13460 [Nocardioides baekrokdamisoli]|uniref:Uncharacterized protein n=1 Tax=Nocardioides baekrokdamisoli TaxID=1804624 RepID=A0A3G9J243_9ACTN|nr:hypothetical protein Back2_13460 [Nocardioides baekrokdamisoli]